jgi:cell wall-associated NlpC family hydrolase
MQFPSRRELVPLSPVFPAAWTQLVFETAYAHAVEAYPDEAVGIVSGGEYHRLVNLSTTPDRDVLLSEADLVRVAEADVFFHTHPDGLGCPSEQDMIYQLQLGVPFVVMTLPHYDIFAFGDQLTRQPIIGRGFRHGVYDCYSLVRDWFGLEGVQLADHPRGWEWWSRGQDLYRANFKKWGFVEIPPSEAIQRGDVLLFSFTFAVPMHAAIVLDRDLMLHHASGIKPVDQTRLSCEVPRNRYQRHVTLALRFHR